MIELWTMILKKRKGVHVSTKRIRRFMKKTNIPNALASDETDAAQHLDIAHAEYKEAKKSDGIWRDEHLESLAEAKAKKNGTTIEQEAKILSTISRQRSQARNIRRMRGKLGKSPTTKVYSTDEDGVRHAWETKETVEAACIAENNARFSQTEGTPAMMWPLVEQLGYLADTPAAEAILQCAYTPSPEMDMYTAKMIAELKMPDGILKGGVTSEFVSTKDHVQSWTKQKEGISSDPDGLSFSYYKAGVQDPQIADFDATRRSLPYQYGFVPTEWEAMTDVEILKKAGVYDIEKMRTILLMNSELNINNKKLGREMMANAEEHGAIAREQYGSRRHHRSITAALNKRLTMDMLRLRRQAGALC